MGLRIERSVVYCRVVHFYSVFITLFKTIFHHPCILRKINDLQRKIFKRKDCGFIILIVRRKSMKNTKLILCIRRAAILGFISETSANEIIAALLLS